MRTGAPWEDLPPRYPSRSKCHRRFQQWTADGTLDKIRRALLTDLNTRGKLKLDEGFIDGTHLP
jgi:transposase